MTWMLLMTAALASTAATAPPADTVAPDLASFAAISFSFAPESTAIGSLDLALGSAHSQQQSPSDSASPAASTTIAPGDSSDVDAKPLPRSIDAVENRYFQRGSWRWQINAAAATDFDDHFALAGVGVSYFIEHDFTIDFELNGLYYLQDKGDNTAGINLAMVLRWHFKIDDAKRWSTFVDAGFGVMFTGENVPFDGEEFNFTPQLGIGFTMLLDEASDARLIAGARVHHTSNANIFEDNPGSNKLLLYAGFNFPF